MFSTVLVGPFSDCILSHTAVCNMVDIGGDSILVLEVTAKAFQQTVQRMHRTGEEYPIMETWF